MSEILDKAVLIGMGLEKKAKEALEELQKAGKAAVDAKAAGGAGAAGEGLSSKQLIENKVVEDAVSALKELLGYVNAGKEKLDKELVASTEKLLEKLHVPTHNDVEVIKEMARISREKVDRLEKMVEEMQARLKRE
ncbi:MAG: hypothetical protein HY886_00790 [Deltaproteobacteria bacterium]|nr:hypothetical protein [Deltaproteobacteria bacterium]